MKLDADILIVGGGLNGPALGLALADTGFDVTIVDAMPKGARGTDGFDGRGYALALASQRLLSAIGVWPLQPTTQDRALLSVSTAFRLTMRPRITSK